MARKAKRYGRANVSPQRSGQIRLIQKSPRSRSAKTQVGPYTVTPARHCKHTYQIVTRMTYSPDRLNRDNSSTSVARLLKSPKDSARHIS
ncbi:hypothetical protein SLE2022_071500 [Rubroshorea leprosula]